MHDLSRSRSKEQTNTSFKLTKSEQRGKELEILVENNAPETRTIENINAAKENSAYIKNISLVQF